MRWIALFACLTGCTPKGSQAPIQLVDDSLSRILDEPFKQPRSAVDLDPNPGVLRLRLVARALPEGHPSGFRYAYNEQTPGPTIEAELGQTLEVELVNELTRGTTIHWHGLHVPNAMDGVPWQRGPIAPGATFLYRFELNQAGTFWYHPHFNTEGQVDGGLFGALIVRDPADEPADHDLVAIVDSRAEARPDPAQPVGPAHGHARLKRQWLMNGHSPGHLNVQAGERVRLRMINVSNHGYLKLNGDSARLVATDQGPLEIARWAQDEVLGPGDRAEIEFLAGGEPIQLSSLPYSLNGGDSLGPTQPLFEVRPSGTQPAPAPLSLRSAGRVQHPDPGYADIVWTFTGSDRTGRWYINGKRFPQITPVEVRLGQTVIIEVRNLSPTDHPYHLHGYSFEVLSRNGVAPDSPTYEDTINLAVRERVRLRIVANNPGDWMSHCHILPHAEDGMMTVLRVID